MEVVLVSLAKKRTIGVTFLYSPGVTDSESGVFGVFSTVLFLIFIDLKDNLIIKHGRTCVYNIYRKKRISPGFPTLKTSTLLLF